MKKNIIKVVLLMLIVALISCETKKNNDSTAIAEDQNETNLGDPDAKEGAEFAVEAADGGLFEVQAATLALTKATSPEVKQFARMMVDEHTKANNELKSLAGEKNIILPDVMSEKCQKKYYDLDQEAKGDDFDREYMDAMVSDHKKDIEKFEKEANNGEDPAIKSWAAGKLAVLRQHLQEAERIRDGLNNNSTSSR